jgi:hypothetical protein
MAKAFKPTNLVSAARKSLSAHEHVANAADARDL